MNAKPAILAFLWFTTGLVLGLEPDNDPLLIVARGRRAQQEGKTADAEKLYRRALELQPYSAEAHQYLGLLLLPGTNKEEAVRHLATVLALRPKAVEVRVSIAESLAGIGYLKDAEGLLRDTLRLQRDYTPALRQLLRVQFALGRKEEAAQTYRALVKLDERNPQLRYDYAQFLLQLNRLDEAASELREAVRLQARFPAAYYQLGLIAGLQGQPAKAIEFYQQAVFWDDSLAEAYNNLGVAYLNLQQEKEAVAMFDKARASFGRRGDSNQVARLAQLLQTLDPQGVLGSGPAKANTFRMPRSP